MRSASQMEIMFDGGIRSGQDVMRALALGAKSCMIGRAYIHGLGAYGGPGVDKALDIIRNELSVTMGLCGVNTHRRDRRPRAGDLGIGVVSSSFSPCGRRWREAPDEGSLSAGRRPLNATPHPSSLREAHPLPQGEGEYDLTSAA